MLTWTASRVLGRRQFGRPRLLLDLASLMGWDVSVSVPMSMYCTCSAGRYEWDHELFFWKITSMEIQMHVPIHILQYSARRRALNSRYLHRMHVKTVSSVHSFRYRQSGAANQTPGCAFLSQSSGSIVFAKFKSLGK